MEAIILAGGKGTRLKPYTTTLPKPLVPVGDRPILSVVMGQLKEAGVTKVTLAVCHLAELIMAFFGSGQKFGLEIEYSLEPEPLGTVGPIRLIEGLPEDFIVMNGDILTDLSYLDLWQSHLHSGAPLTIATYQRDSLIDFGVLEVDERTRQVRGFREKPIFRFEVSMGIYVFSRRLLELIPPNQPYGLDNLVLDLLSRGCVINTHHHDGYWLDLGRPDDYDRANGEIEHVMGRNGR
jgi:NDP-sugar pyrophosphorylase family protein